MNELSIKNCEECPCGARDDDDDPGWFCSLIRRRNDTIVLYYADTPPDWCPLRKGPYLLRLMEEEK